MPSKYMNFHNALKKSFPEILAILSTTDEVTENDD